MKRGPVFIAATGTISAIGKDVPSSLDSLEKGKAGIDEICWLQSRHKGKLPVAEVKFSNSELAEICGLSGLLPRAALLAAVAAREALPAIPLLCLVGEGASCWPSSPTP